MPPFKAVLFDIGGVCVGSPLGAINKYELAHGLPKDYINVAMYVSPSRLLAVSAHINPELFRLAYRDCSRTTSRFAAQKEKLERGELKIAEFYDRFSAELSDPKNKEFYALHLKKQNLESPPIPLNVIIDGKELFRLMMKEATIVDLQMLEAIRRIKASGRFLVAALTNNFQLPDDDPREVELLGGKPPAHLVSLFDEFIESSVVGLRKPDPRIFFYACEKLKIDPVDAVFLDDIGMNLKAAQNIGMSTIRVKLGNTEEAIKELQALIGIPLLDGPSSKL